MIDTGPARLKIALVVPGGFERPDGPVPPRSIPALHTLVHELTRGHEVHVFCTDFDARGGTWVLGDATVHDPGRVAPSHLPWARLATRTWRLSRAIEKAASLMAFDVVHAFWVDGNGLAASVVARELSVPFVASVGGGECAAVPDIGYGGAVTLRGRLATRAILASADVVTVGSDKARQLIPVDNVAVVPLGCSRATFDAPTARAPGPPWRLVHVAHRNAVKDPWTLAEAVRTLVARGVDVHLDWFGADTLDGAIERWTRAASIDARITFHGQRSPDEVARALAAAHLHILASRHESQCVAVLEAALAGVATVGTDVGLVSDLAPWAAVAVPGRDASALANAMSALLGDDERRHGLASAAQDYARRHDARWTGEAFVRLYRKAAERHARR